MPLLINMINISPVLWTFGEKVAKTEEMLIMLIAFLEKVAKTGEMLIMLIMLIVFGTFREGFHKQKGPFWLTWLTFPPF